ncbi:MAG TPA: anti-sigma regulatory factor [Oligoflexus sp.]|uniref:anti-sigma regulatory factor n=1 Tax=Oligoflexus sp. TaxID=1971216 RepID=UPI002D2DC2F5|nr:anti-sigma regulatory factor [Oligoflexus sp.]HYX37745.1 anti-sigma regulatory factor [Oligoflexus sp.]
MEVLKHESVLIREEAGVVEARQKAKALAQELNLGLTNQTKVVTAVSEIARNTLIYGGGGTATLEILQEIGRKGLRITFTDKGPGIANLTLALTDGFTTGSGMGLGLSGAKRLVDEFELDSRPGEGTRVVLTKWK